MQKNLNMAAGFDLWFCYEDLNLGDKEVTVSDLQSNILTQELKTLDNEKREWTGFEL